MSTQSRYIELMDTTLRDGEQTQGVFYTPNEKLSIAKVLLDSLNVDRIEVASARVSEDEKQAVKNINKWAREKDFEHRIEVLGFVDHTLSVDWILESGGSVINLLTKGSEKHCRGQLGKTPEKHIDDIVKTIDYALEKGLAVNIYLEDWSNGYQDNQNYVFALIDKLQHIGIGHFMLPDTLGIMSPDEVFNSLSVMHERYTELHFDFHPHNDYGLATANVMAAVRAGIKSIHCTVNCLGERAGNVSLSQVSTVLRDKMNMQLSIDEKHLVDASNMVENFSGKQVAANAPIIGNDVFTQTAGIHADGDQKGGLYKSKLTPERFSRIHSYALGKMSGKASLKKNLQLLRLDLSEEIQKKILNKIIELSNSKHITTEDLPFIIADVMESKSYQHIKLLHCAITSNLELESTANIIIKIKGNEEQKTSGSGNGGFNAFTDAINKAMQPHYTLPTLVDYKVLISKTKKGEKEGNTDALTECIITWDCDKQTRGVHSDQVFAAIEATLKIINIQLHERHMGGQKSTGT